MKTVEEFLKDWLVSIQQNTFVKLTLSQYDGEEVGLKNLYIREVLIKRVKKLAFTFRYKTRDIVKNYEQDEAISVIRTYLTKGFQQATLFTTACDLLLTVKRAGQAVVKRRKPTFDQLPGLSHDKRKERAIEASSGKAYLQALRIMDATGQVYKQAQDKYKQINHYIALLKPLIEEVGIDQIHEVIDMGSGKGYLTFALYDYLSQILLHPVKITGVEFRRDLVDFCNQVAQDAGFDGLSFREGAILSDEQKTMDMLVALHACDTATDDAIYKGIQAKAKLIVVAPCCHKQIRREMEKGQVDLPLLPLTRYGIFLERQAEMLTDSIRALILEYFGYRVKVLEFISDTHTPKNVMIAATKIGIKEERKEEVLQQIKALKASFGVPYHYLEQLLHIM